ncbi:hypothetical protein pb186bvf_020226 [Paramecium bursaria]
MQIICLFRIEVSYQNSPQLYQTYQEIGMSMFQFTQHYDIWIQ